jgi:hypothetical protein
MGGGCSIGDLTFSDFVYQFTPTSDSPATPDPSTDVTLDFDEITDNVTSDPFGTVGTSTTPLYQVIVNLTAGNTVAENQSERYILQYLVADTAGSQIIQVDNNIVGGAAVIFGSSGGLTAKSLCDGGPFNSNAGTPTGACSSGSVYASVAPNGGSQFLSNPDSQADSSINYNGPSQKFGGTIGSSNFGVYDQADINGGTSSPFGAASVTQVESDFLESASSVTPTPEPGGQWACALAGALGIFRLIRQPQKR